MNEMKILPKSVAEKACDFLDGEEYALQELSECIKWLAELQIYQGTKDNADVHNSEEACGSWYVAKINQTIAQKMILLTEKMLSEA